MSQYIDHGIVKHRQIETNIKAKKVEHEIYIKCLYYKTAFKDLLKGFQCVSQYIDHGIVKHRQIETNIKAKKVEHEIYIKCLYYKTAFKDN